MFRSVDPDHVTPVLDIPGHGDSSTPTPSYTANPASHLHPDAPVVVEAQEVTPNEHFKGGKVITFDSKASSQFPVSPSLHSSLPVVYDGSASSVSGGSSHHVSGSSHHGSSAHGEAVVSTVTATIHRSCRCGEALEALEPVTVSSSEEPDHSSCGCKDGSRGHVVSSSHETHASSHHSGSGSGSSHHSSSESSHHSSSGSSHHPASSHHSSSGSSHHPGSSHHSSSGSSHHPASSHHSSSGSSHHSFSGSSHHGTTVR